MTRDPLSLLTSGISRLRAALETAPHKARPIIYMPEAHESAGHWEGRFTGVDAERIEVLTEAIDHHLPILRQPGTILVVTLAQTWLLRDPTDLEAP